jgi:hypothetical protein
MAIMERGERLNLKFEISDFRFDILDLRSVLSG